MRNSFTIGYRNCSSQRLNGLEFVTPGDEQAVREDIGPLNIHVHGCNSIHVEYEFIGLGSGELDFKRLTAIQGRECLDNSVIP